MVQHVQAERSSSSGQNRTCKLQLPAMIKVRHISEDRYQVTIHETTPTTHTVTLPERDRVRLAGDKIPAERLIEESFRFLLEREPNTSILRAFELPAIARYFPEYDREIRQRLT